MSSNKSSPDMSETASASKTERRSSETKPKNLSNPEEKEGKRRKKRKKRKKKMGKEEGEGERWKARSLFIREINTMSRN